MTTSDQFADLGRLPAPGDNVAIATRRIAAGTPVSYGATDFTIDYTVLEGHRFAIAPIAPGAPLLSWGLPFGYASRPILPGNYVCNPKILRVLRGRDIDFALPDTANFADTPLLPYELDEVTFRPGVPLAPAPGERTFLGYPREGGRGVGTRNFVVILGTSSLTNGYAAALEEHFRDVPARYRQIDGVVAVTHTEGGESGRARPNNLELLLRTLAGFAVHPNVGAILAVDYESAAVTNRLLADYLRAHAYPLDSVPHHFLTLTGGFSADLARGVATIESWLPQVDAARRTPQPLATLALGLQCGGSDAFSGVSGNPLAAWVAREVIRHGGIANLAETDELIGAEAYVLQNVRDLTTARAFLAAVERFKERVSWHGHTAEGNPSGGNNYRGLYNIALKSLGAAMKRHPDVRLDAVIEYGERMTAPGYYFMDSPGNDLESIAGQVAAGSNLLFFITGNGSITNFPFVPTLKIVTTTDRYRLLEREMDVNAGAYLDGTPMDQLGARLLEQTVAAASGERTAGERAGHAQVSIWRDWRQTGRQNLALIERLQAAPELPGAPLPLAPAPEPPPTGSALPVTFLSLMSERGPVTDQVGLVMPTSLCAGQVARQIAARLNAAGAGASKVSRFVALPHTEGCGVSSGASETLYTRTLLGHLLHPIVRAAVLVEHGCEKTHNDYLRQELRARSVDLARFGWASIQLDGGIAAATARVADWFDTTLAAAPELAERPAGLGALRLGLGTVGPLDDDAARAFAALAREVVAAGGTVVVPENAALLTTPGFTTGLLAVAPHSTLAYGQEARQPGLQVMETPTRHWVETLTGLGATGVELIVGHTAEHPPQGHRLVPVLRVSSNPATIAAYRADLDLALMGNPASWPDDLLDLVTRTASRTYTPLALAQRDTDFQFTRGLLGVSM